MRVGLLVVGAAVALIGAGVLLASFSLSQGATSSQLDTVSLPAIAPHSTFGQQLGGVNQSSATVSLDWSSTGYLDVAVFPAVPCPHGPGVCPSSKAAASWSGISGRWSTSGSFSFPLFLNLSNPNATPTAFSATFRESYTTSSPVNPTLSLFVSLVGAVVLFIIGGVAVFLGLFLPKGVYSPGRGQPITEDPDEEYEDFDDEELDGDVDDPPPSGGG